LSTEPCIQILPIEEFLHGAEVKMPPQFGTFKQAQKLAKVPDKAQYIPLYSPQMKVFEVACEALHGAAEGEKHYRHYVR
jgi:hypothetical protein